MGQGKQIWTKHITKAAQERSREQGCCKIILDVLERNEGAQSLYAKLDYGDVVLNDSTGRTLHWDKKLPALAAALEQPSSNQATSNSFSP